MQIPLLPANETERLEALRALNLLDTAAEARFDRLTHLATQLLDMPIALVSLVDAKRQWFKSRQGIDATETARDISFCGHAILGDETFVVNDATQDPRFADNPLVAGAPDIRFYAGRPLKTTQGLRVGTLCLIDKKPRQLTPAQLAVLDALAELVEREFQLADLERARKEIFNATREWAATQQALQQAQRWNQTIIDHAASSIIATDPQGAITVFNHGAERLLGYDAQEVVGKVTPAVIHDPQEVVQRAAELSKELGKPIEPGFDTFVAKPRLLGVADEHEWTYIRKDGGRVPVHLSVTALRDAEGTITGYLGIASDISERKAAQAALVQFKGTLDRTRDCVFMFDPVTLKFFYVNRGAMEQVGYDEATLLQMHPYDIKPAFSKEQFCDMIAPLLRGEKESLNFETVHRHRDGTDIPVEIMLQYIAPADEQARFVAVVRDISERREVDRLKGQFVSTVSHELRTPLTAIRGALGLLRGGVAGALPEKARELIDLASQNTTRLLALISDLLDMEKIAQGRLEFEMQPHAVMPLVEQALTTNDSYAEQYGVTYRLVMAAPGARVTVDANRFQQVLANLLSNAAKFSPRGGLVDVAVTQQEGVVRIAVTDHGAGIPEAFRARIFQRFAQADASDARQKGGTGLGLAITKSMVEHMGGAIRFETESGQGTTFYVDLPVCAEGSVAVAQP